MERALQNYLEELKSDVSSLVYSDGEGASFEDKFTEYCIEIFESIGKSEGARVLSYVHPNNLGGIEWKINGYCLKDHYRDENNNPRFETLDLFITYYNNLTYDYNILQSEYNKSLVQIKKFLNAALKKHINYIDPSNTELIELIKIIGKQGGEFDRINIYFLINGFCNHDKEKLEINGIDIFVHTWDVTRFFKINESNSSHEPIEIDFESFSINENGLQCLKVPTSDEIYDCYLTIVSGDILAKLYKEFSNELLESNVRAFLGQAGKYNKGIRDTIREKPQMFLPYNNGITATAESVETKLLNNQLTITKLKDFQIVNGGQTTASLYHTKKKYKDADLSKIYVQMKLTVIKDIEQKNLEVPLISRFANSQNKVSELDLSSNNPYFVQIENLSRRKYTTNPENKNQSNLWFFERTNGQYRETLNKLSTSQQKKFKEQAPSNLKFVKSDVAKYINLWELEPHFVSQGSQKNFIHYTKKLDELIKKNKFPGENFYYKLIANAILFKTLDRIFGRKNIDAIGDTNLKSFTVAYSLSYFHFLTNKRLDLWKIYEEQKLDIKITSYLKELLIFVYNHLVNSSNNSLISEYAKRETSWQKLKETKYPKNLELILDSYLVSKEENELREVEKTADNSKIDNIVFLVDEIQKMGIKFWDGFRIFISQNDVEGFNFMMTFDILKKLKDRKNLTPREVAYGKRVLDYVRDQEGLYEKIKSLSKMEETEIIEIKFIFDKLLLLSKYDWDKIIAIAEQTKIFNNLELSNIKSIRMSITRSEKIKEQGIIKAFESIQKLKKFGISI